MTAKVRSRVTDGLTLKIDKNVKIGEIDHNGAFSALYECFKTLVQDYFTAFEFKQVKKLLLKSDWKQWRLFCFVLFCRFRKSIHLDKNDFFEQKVNDVNDVFVTVTVEKTPSKPVQVSDWKQWRLFCFVLSTSKINQFRRK